MEPRNVLLVGGQKRCWQQIFEYLRACGVQIFDHWLDEKSLRKALPTSVDWVIIIASHVSHALDRHATKEAEKNGKVVIRTDHRFAKFPEVLKKWGIEPLSMDNVPVILAEPPPEEEERTTPLLPIELTPAATPLPSPAVETAVETPIPPPEETVQAVPVPPAVPPAVEKEKQMAKKSKPLKATQVRAQQKIDYLKELLGENPYMSPDALNAKIAAKYPGKHPNKPGGVSKPVIAKFRAEEHGIKIGPGGRFLDVKSGKQIEVPEKFRGKPAEDGAAKADAPARIPKNGAATNGHAVATYRTARTAAADSDMSQDRLKQLAAQIRTWMQNEGVESLSITNGGIQLKRTIQEEISL
jgi:hypothetical protein